MLWSQYSPRREKVHTDNEMTNNGGGLRKTIFARCVRKWGCILYMGASSAGAAVDSTCCCGGHSEMFLLVLITCLTTTTTTATNTTTSNGTTEIEAIEPNNNSTKEILSASETGDSSKIEIVKQIRRLNDDGSYTIGYEADDGTFKIESRDVRGNVKGTYGYIDKDGEIKRVTYTSSSDSTPVPVTTTSATPNTPLPIVRVNKTVSSTTRRPLATIVYPTRGSYTTRAPVVQSIPRRRATTSTTKTPVDVETTTEKQQPVDSGSNILNLYKSRSEDGGSVTRTQLLNPVLTTIKEDLVAKQTTTHSPHSTVKPVYEVTDEKEEIDPNKANTIRRQLSGTSPNPHMMNLQQSAGDDSTDVYGSHLSLGTVRPLFTTTTQRPRLIALQPVVGVRPRLHQQYQDVSVQEQETTIEASTGRVFDQGNDVTSNPVPVVHIAPREHNERYHQQPIYRRPTSGIHFRTTEFLRENPGAAVPIGNHRPFLHYEYQNKVLEPQFLKEASHQQQKASSQTPAVQPYEVRPATRIIPIPVDDRGIPIQAYQGRLVNAYQPPPQPLFQPRYEPLVEDMNSISAPVSTRDLKRLLQILILRQNRLQALMDQIVASGPPYQHLPVYRQDYERNRYQARQYQDDQYDYQYEQPQQTYNQQYTNLQDYSNQMGNYDNSQSQYESQRYVPRRRLYTRPVYDTAGSSSNRVEEAPEFLPVEIREALLLKMLMLAINPDYVPTPAPATELTTAAPTRKHVRNVQILGEESSMETMKRTMHRH